MNYSVGPGNGWSMKDSAKSFVEYELANGNYDSGKRSGSAKGINRFVIIAFIVWMLANGTAGVLTLLILAAFAAIVYGVMRYVRRMRK